MLDSVRGSGEGEWPSAVWVGRGEATAAGQARLRYFRPPMPASTGVVVNPLSDPALLFEVDVVAAIPAERA